MSAAESSAPSRSSRPAWVSFAVGTVIVIGVVVLFVLLRGSDDEGGSPSGVSGASGAAATPSPSP